MSLSCDKAREALLDLAWGEIPAGIRAGVIEAHKTDCPDCRLYSEEVARFLALFTAENVVQLDWARFHSTIGGGADRLSAKRRRETAAFVAVACGIAAGFWLGLGAVSPMLPIYVQFGVAANLGLFFMPVFFLRRRQPEG